MLRNLTLFGQTIPLYDLFNNLSYVMHAVLFVLLLKRVGEASTLPALADAYLNRKKKKDFFHRWVYVLLQFLIMYLPYQFLSGLVGPLISRIFLHTSAANFFVNIFFFPVYGILVAILFRVTISVFMDACALLIGSSLIFFKIACYCEGCCYGIEYGSVFYNHANARYELPVQLIEAASALVIVIVLGILYKRNKKSGLLFPLFMILYCGTRFVSEFWRDDFPVVLGGLKAYHIQCILGFVLGAAYLAVVLVWGDRILAYFEKKNKAFAEKNLAKLSAKKRGGNSNAPRGKKKR